MRKVEDPVADKSDTIDEARDVPSSESASVRPRRTTSEPPWQRAPPSFSDTDYALESKERVLAELVIAVVVQLSRIRDIVNQPSSSGELATSVEDVTRLMHFHIGRLNTTWISRKRVDRNAALEEAWKSLREIGQVPAVSQFLALGLRSEALRPPCVQIAGLLEVSLDRREPNP